MLPRKILKLGSSAWLKMNFRQQNSLTFPLLLEFCRKFPDFQRCHSNFLTFPGFQVSGNPAKNISNKTYRSTGCREIITLPVKVMSRSTHHNVCAVHQGVCSTLEDVQYIGGYHEYTGGVQYTGRIP